MAMLINQEVPKILASRGIVFACRFNPLPILPLDWQGVNQGIENDEKLWLHLDRHDTFARAWLVEKSQLDSITSDSLLEEDSRPRLVKLPTGLLMIVYTINRLHQSDVDAMHSLRVWIDERRIITLSGRRMPAIDNIARQCQSEETLMETTGSILSNLLEEMCDDIRESLIEIEEELDMLEVLSIDRLNPELRQRLNQHRRQILIFRRYIAPQRDVLLKLMHEKNKLLLEVERNQIHEVANTMIRFVEDIDLMRERLVVLEEELTAHNSDQLNRSMYRLAVITTIFLPLTFVTGLLGINVGGIPGAEHTMGFWFVCGVIGLLTLLEILFLYLARWL